MSWFEELTGFSEADYATTQKQFRVEGERLVSRLNNRSWQIGRVETPSLAELRERADLVRAATRGELSVRNLVADVHALHAQSELNGALVQVASQFNLLEMPNARVTPEKGISSYEHDHTQGPACARAAGAGTIYRNYFFPIEGQIGQRHDRQIDTLADLRRQLKGGDQITMQNGYALAETETLRTIQRSLKIASSDEIDALRQQLRIGLHWDQEVTVNGASPQQRVTQAYCSALPVSYNDNSDPQLWRKFATLVLEAAYEATLLAALINAARSKGSQRVYLTLLGGGAFGNDREWIRDAIQRALNRVRGQKLEVYLVSYGHIPADLERLLSDF